MTEEKTPIPETYQDLAKGHPILQKTKAKAIPVSNGILIGLVNAEHISKLDFPERQKIVTLVSGWARHKFAGKHIAGVVLYDRALEDLMKAIAPLNASTVTIINHRRWPDKWSKGISSE